MENLFNKKSKNQFLYKKLGVSVYIKREDLLHQYISGNKFRKLKYNLLQAKKNGFESLLTFGGAYSNHITATAYAGKLFKFKTIGIIRGEELGNDLQKTLNQNSSLKFAYDCGMEFEFISREQYKNKTDLLFLEELKKTYNSFYLIPEGGTNELAIKGCEEILTKEDQNFDYICSAIGTGGTISGLINSKKTTQKILGFPALKGDFLEVIIENLVENKKNWELINDYHFGGFAKINEELVCFMNDFKNEFNISLDPIYTSKLMFGINNLIEKEYFSKGTHILAIHSGGLQGIEPMNNRLLKKGMPIIV